MYQTRGGLSRKKYNMRWEMVTEALHLVHKAGKNPPLLGIQRGFPGDSLGTGGGANAGVLEDPARLTRQARDDTV